ncbi:hypothetical protein IT417_01785 [bacterium]|nr:hypothetical protein [bacterium]
MLVEIAKFIKKVSSERKWVNYLAGILTVFMFFSVMNIYAQEAGATIKLDPVEGYRAETALTKNGTGDTSYNSQTTTMNVILGALNGALQNMAPQLLSNFAAIESDPAVPAYAKMGALGLAGEGVNAMMNNYNGVNIVNYMASEWVPGYDKSTSVYAATDGYSYLDESNVDVLWDRIRLITYVLFVVVLIVAGFMIMFRQKIGGQLAVSIFNTLPNVIVALILVTFSFAIVGLMLNVGVMIINVMTSVLGVADPLTIENPFSLFGTAMNGELLGGGTTAALVIGPAIIAGLIAAVTATGGAALPAVVAATVTVIVIAVILTAIVIYASIRVYITLLIAYLGIIINTVMAPIFLAISAFPGQSGMASDWFRRVLKAVLTFPIVYFFLNLGMFIINGDINLGFPSGIMSGDFTQVDTNGSPVGGFIKAVLVLLLFFFAADAPKILDDFLPSNEGKGVGSAIEGAKKGLSKIPVVGSLLG